MEHIGPCWQDLRNGCEKTIATKLLGLPLKKTLYMTLTFELWDIFQLVNPASTIVYKKTNS